MNMVWWMKFVSRPMGFVYANQHMVIPIQQAWKRNVTTVMRDIMVSHIVKVLPIISFPLNRILFLKWYTYFYEFVGEFWN